MNKLNRHFPLVPPATYYNKFDLLLNEGVNCLFLVVEIQIKQK